MNNLIKTFVIVSLLSLYALPASAKKAPDQTFDFHLNYQLVLAANGSIETLELKRKDIKLEAVAQFEKKIRSWQFTPATIDGVPQKTETNLWVRVQANPAVDGSYAVKILDAGTGTGAPNMLAAPTYPHNELRQGKEAVLRLLISYDATGKVISAEQSGVKQQGDKPFEVASVRAAKQWRFVPEKINGVGVPGQAYVPIRFCTDRFKCKSLLTGSAEKEKLAQELARQTVSIGSRVGIQRQL